MLRKKPPNGWNKRPSKRPAHSRLSSHLIEVRDSLPRYTLELLTPRLRVSPIGNQQNSPRLRDPYHLGGDPLCDFIVGELQEHHGFHRDIKRVVAERKFCRVIALEIHLGILRLS